MNRTSKYMKEKKTEEDMSLSRECNYKKKYYQHTLARTQNMSGQQRKKYQNAHKGTNDVRVSIKSIAVYSFIFDQTVLLH